MLHINNNKMYQHNIFHYIIDKDDIYDTYFIIFRQYGFRYYTREFIDDIIKNDNIIALKLIYKISEIHPIMDVMVGGEIPIENYFKEIVHSCLLYERIGILDWFCENILGNNHMNILYFENVFIYVLILSKKYESLKWIFATFPSWKIGINILIECFEKNHSNKYDTKEEYNKMSKFLKKYKRRFNRSLK